MIEELKKLLGPEWEVEEVGVAKDWKQVICSHPKNTYYSAWYKEMSMGNVVYVARMCNLSISEPVEDYQDVK